jgi:hypothetical protein
MSQNELDPKSMHWLHQMQTGKQGVPYPIKAVSRFNALAAYFGALVMLLLVKTG